MTTVTLSPVYNAWQGFGTTGLPLAGGLLYTYAAGTTTPLATYTTYAGTVANANPIVLASDGRPPQEIWLMSNTAYKFILKTAAGVTITTYDNITSTDAVAGQFLQAGTGAASRTVQSKLRDGILINADDFGASAGGTSSANAAGIQAAINYAATLGGGVVQLNAGTYSVNDTLVLPSKVILAGQGSATTEIFLANGTNKTVIKSLNYDTLVGTDTYLVAAGNQHAFGLRGLRINGNKANQSSGYGVQFYGKRLRVDDVIITSCKQEGWHSESNQSIPGTPAANGDDFPEGLIRGLYVWQCDSHGFVFRGQHDTYIESLFVGECSGWGVRFETRYSAPYYSGNCNSGFLHIYANTAGGIYVDALASHKGAFWITESNFGQGLQCDGWQVVISLLELYTNCRSTGTYQATFAGYEGFFPCVHVKDAGVSKSGVQITGQRNIFGINAMGSGSTGCGVDVNNALNDVTVVADSWSGVGGIALRTGNTTQVQHSRIKASLNNSTICWNNASIGTNNSYLISGYAGAGKDFFTGSGPNVGKTENWLVSGYTNGTTQVFSENRTRSINAIDLNTTTEQEITVAHGLLTTPQLQDISPSVLYLNSNATWTQTRLYVRSVDATNAKIRFKAGVAAGGADTADLLVTFKL